jgi:flagellar basal body-associated protein FliL
MGFFYYSKMMYKRPPITEEGERERLSKTYASPTPPPAPALVKFDPITINISPNPEEPKPADGTLAQLQGKLHYVTIGFSLEIRDEGQKELIEGIRPFILDQLIVALGKKKTHELTSVQGRYVLHAQLIDLVNKLVVTKTSFRSKEGLITNIFFSHFVVQ